MRLVFLLLETPLRIGLFLRSLLFTVLMAIATVIWSFVCIICGLFSYRTRYYITSRWNAFVIWCAKNICGIHYQVKGLDNLPDGPAILLSKHQSAWETISYLLIMPRPLVFVFKKELMYIPFFGWGIALLRMIPIDRKQGKDAFNQVIKHSKDRLAQGLWIIMFPEGTRVPVGERIKYKHGGAKLAVETHTPVVPIAMNSGEFWPKHGFIKKPGTITVSIGKPISSEGLTAAELNQKVEDWIESEMRVISPDVYKNR